MPPRRDYVEKNINEDQQEPSTRSNPLVEQAFHAKFSSFQVLSQSIIAQDNPEVKVQ